ncbi:MAG: hypothetical protein AB2A00_04050 [Myxococcota bacterium]
MRHRIKSLALVGACAVTVTLLQPAPAHAHDPSSVAGVPQPGANATPRVWLSFSLPSVLKPELQQYKEELAVASFLPFGALWGPMLILGQELTLDWSLPLVLPQAGCAILMALALVPVIGWVTALPTYAFLSWLCARTLVANLNRPDVAIGAHLPELPAPIGKQ